VDDLQILLNELELKGSETPKYFETNVIPANFLHFVRISAKAKTECCPPRSFVSVYQAEEANIDIMLSDNFKSPSFEWAETVCTVIGNKIRIYTNDQFNVVEPRILYYRKPLEVKFARCMNPSTGTTYTADQNCEFKDDIAEILVDETASILAGDIESMTQYQRSTQNAQRNS
jgi:hypothetical protein